MSISPSLESGQSTLSPSDETLSRNSGTASGVLSRNSGTASGPWDLGESDGRVFSPPSEDKRTTLRNSVREKFEFVDESVRRATKVSHVLRFCGKTLRNSRGTAATYDMSHCVQIIDGFVSHNWRTSANQKFLALAMYYNLALASFLTFLCMTLINVLLAWRNRLPELAEDDDSDDGKRGIVCTTLGTPLFFLLLVFVRDVLPCSGSTVFLDKICIHQVDADLKRAGIACLGAFLCDSKKLVLVYTELYLQQLWTVFELGTFLTLRSPQDVVVLPPVEAQLTTASSLVWYMSVSVYVLYRRIPLISMLEGLGEEAVLAVLSIIGAVGILCISMALRRLARERGRCLLQAHDFHTTQANCSCESDRPVVNGLIVNLMRELGYAAKNASGKRSLFEFDKLVHKTVPTSLSRAFPATGLAYSHVLVVVQATFWLECDRVAGLWKDGHKLNSLCAHIMLSTTVYFVVLPSFVVLMFFLSTRRLHSVGWIQAMILASVPAVCAPLWAILQLCLSRARGFIAKDAQVALALVGVSEAFLLLFVYALYKTRVGATIATRAVAPETIGTQDEMEFEEDDDDEIGDLPDVPGAGNFLIDNSFLDLTRRVSVSTTSTRTSHASRMSNVFGAGMRLSRMDSTATLSCIPSPSPSGHSYLDADGSPITGKAKSNGSDTFTPVKSGASSIASSRSAKSGKPINLNRMTSQSTLGSIASARISGMGAALQRALGRDS